ncbi:hypothetical protein [Jiangella muralis]|uniref:hypothetical protein n=1 Tax=Jiangella muralis TaxID=702383 RepID=UPI00069F5669|nr:hypothetical protein [Jiangella muralis]
MIGRSLTRAACAAVLVLALAACSDNGEETPMNPLSTTAPSGDLLSDFVPRESVVLALGTDDVEAPGGSVQHGSEGTLISAGSEVYVDGDPVLSVTVEQAMGILRSGFEDRLASDQYTQLPDDVGLGFSWSEDEEQGGESVPVGHAWLAHGIYVVRVSVTGLAEGRDHEADAVALAQQVVQTLELPDAWTLNDPPLSR